MKTGHTTCAAQWVASGVCVWVASGGGQGPLLLKEIGDLGMGGGRAAIGTHRQRRNCDWSTQLRQSVPSTTLPPSAVPGDPVSSMST
jgi:hypothetical protein